MVLMKGLLVKGQVPPDPHVSFQKGEENRFQVHFFC
jgi:hypothetical protein